MLEKIADMLRGIEAPGAFATRRTVAADRLHIEVKGVGPVKLPVSAAAARRLSAVARPARYGLREQTLFDPGVRDGWEIDRRRIKIDRVSWNRVLVPQLVGIQRELGLACAVRAELHNMLVYGPGQFFAPHQDSEKTDDMIGTLVVMLPSAFRGGALAIEHRGEKVLYQGSARKLTLIGFYADCHHEVRQVVDGYRIALTYNLVLEGRASAAGIGAAAGAAALPARQIDALARRVREHFDTPYVPRWPHEAPQEPSDRLIYLLDHQYTQRSLAWHRLKNGDAVRAAALREVAGRLGCEIFLALADVHESWSCDDDGEWGGWGHDESADDPADHTLSELLDSSIELRHWVDASGREAQSISTDVLDQEVCCTIPSADLEPFRSEHEGYMGNYGNTMDRWYHRAAIVLWPRERTFAVRARASAAWAIRELSKTAATGDVDRAKEMAKRVLPFWKSIARRGQGRGFLEKTLRVAWALGARELAASLLAPFELERLTPTAAPQCIRLIERYGLEWVKARLEEWSSGCPSTARAAWLASLPALCGRLCSGDSPGGLELARWLVSEQWAMVRADICRLRENFSARQRIEELVRLGKPLLGLLESSLVARSPELQREILGFLTDDESGYPLRCCLRLLRIARSIQRPRMLDALGLAIVHEHCARALAARLDAPPRAEGDWSIPAPQRCKCDLCKKLGRLLAARSETRLEWPLAQERRSHVHRILDGEDLPVTHVTRRSGRPYTLVLTKTEALFQREAIERRSFAADLAWLTKERRAFGLPSRPTQKPIHGLAEHRLRGTELQ